MFGSGAGLGGGPMPTPEVPVFVISVAAELTGLHPQTLRTYDRMGLVSPGRAGGGGRRYSMVDIELLREVASLTAEGIGLEGVRRILALERRLAQVRHRLAEREEQLAEAEFALSRLATERSRVANLPVLADQVGDRAVVVWRRAH